MFKTGRLAVSALALLLVLQLGCVVREVVVTPTPGPADTSEPGAAATPVPQESVEESTRPAEASPTQEERVYQLGITADLTTTNFWAYLGPDGTTWNRYVLAGGQTLSLRLLRPEIRLGALARRGFSVAAPRGDRGRTNPLEHGDRSEAGSEVERRCNDVTADDFVFTAHTATELQLTGKLAFRGRP